MRSYNVRRGKVGSINVGFLHFIIYVWYFEVFGLGDLLDCTRFFKILTIHDYSVKRVK